MYLFGLYTTSIYLWRHILLFFKYSYFSLKLLFSTLNLIIKNHVLNILYQAILCRLEGAEELSVSAIGDELVVQRLPGEVLVAAPGPRTDPADPAVAVVLYDTSTQLDLNLNKEIVHDFCIAGAFTLTKVCSVVFLLLFLAGLIVGKSLIKRKITYFALY